MNWSIINIGLLILIMTIGTSAQTIFKVEDAPVSSNGKVGIRGNQYPLSWDKSIYLDKDKNNNRFHFVSISFPDSVDNLEYKFVIEQKKEVKWEGTSNRNEQLVQKDTTFISEWNVEKFIDPTSLPFISSENLLEDLEVIKNAILKVHPGLYRYNTPEDVEKNLAKLEEAYSQPLSYSDAFLHLSRFIATIQCDHTSASFWNQEGLMHSLLHMQKNKVPFTFRWVEGKMIITRNASRQEIERGSEILSINGISSSTILENMMPYIPADGHTPHSKVAKAEVDGYAYRYSAFDVLFPLMHPITNEKIQVVISLANGDTKELQLETLTSKERNRILKERYEDYADTPDDLWEYKMLDGEVGYLKIGSFGTNMFVTDWKAMLKDAFKLFREEAKTLIIDIRENQGGMDDASYELRKYLFRETCDTEFFQGQGRFLDFPEEVIQHITTWDSWFYNLKDGQYYQDGIYYVFPRERSRGPASKGARTFEGELFLLTSGKNVSGAFFMANIFRECNLGKIVGTETGGNLNGVNGGTILFLKPPHSRINVNLPVIGSFSKEEKPDKGVVPDHEVKLTQKDITNGIDTQLEFVKKLIREE